MQNVKKRRRDFKLLKLAGMGVAVSVLMYALYITQPYLVSRLEHSVYDAFMRAVPKPQPASNLAVLDIDEESLALLGQWPWPRYMFADIIARLTEAGVSAIGIDIILSEPDRTSPELIAKRLEEDLGLKASLTGVPLELQNYDNYMGGALKDTKTVLAFFSRFDGEGGIPEKLPRTFTVVERAEKGAPSAASIKTATNVTFPLPVLSANAYLGYTNAGGDSDGVVRSVPLLTRVGNKIYPSLALATFIRSQNLRSIILNSDAGGLKSVTVGEYDIPVGQNALFYVPFTGGSYSYPYYSAGDLLQGKLDETLLKDKIIFIGSSAIGLLDIRTIPLSSVYPGVELHLALTDAFQSGRSIIKLPFEPALQILGIICAALISSFLFGLLRPSVYFPAGLFLCLGTVALSWHYFKKGVFFSPLYITLTTLICATILVCVRFWREEAHKRFIKNAFGRYVAPEVVDSIAQQEDDFLSGQKRQMTILFSDLRGFTSMSERLDPKQVAELLNDYFTPMTRIVRNSGGTLDKFIGDALMAFWNAPLDVPEHAKKAVEACLKMRRTLEELNIALKAKYNIELKMGMGLHTGSVYVGNMGSEELLDYTVIGDNVNLASRLEGLSKVYGQTLIVSGDTAKEVKVYQPEQAESAGWYFWQLDLIRVKGKQQAVEIYTPLTLEEYEERREEIELFELGRGYYSGGEFKGARDTFEELASKYDSPLYALFAERARELLATAPEQWDGAWTFVTK